MVDRGIIDALYTASQAGRADRPDRAGHLLPAAGVPGLSDNIRVRSIVGRWLEHSRIYYFGAGATAGWAEGGGRAGPRAAVYLVGSADMMERNLDRRVESRRSREWIDPRACGGGSGRSSTASSSPTTLRALGAGLADGAWHKVAGRSDRGQRPAGVAGARHQPGAPPAGVPAVTGPRWSERSGGRARREPATASMPAPVRAAGGVVWRRGGAGEVEVVLVHRPRYDDWSLPKGKVDPGETDEQAALREVQEEASVEARSGRSCRPRPTWTGAGSRSGFATGP